MNKLDKIEERMNNRWTVHGQDSVGGPTVHHDYAQCNVDVTLLIQAARQLGVERGAFQALFEVVDNDHKTIKTHAPEVYSAFLVVTKTAEPDLDVLELINDNH